jgi:hypothetical protein
MSPAIHGATQWNNKVDQKYIICYNTCIVNKKEPKMGTRSRIGVMHGDVCKSVYCHWDGYLEHNGAILQEHYNSAKANNLVALGDLSALRPEIGDQHPFSQFEVDEMDRDEFIRTTENMCTFYGRDRLETGIEFKSDLTFEAFFDRAEGCGAEWFYVMQDGVWYVGNTDENDGKFYKKLVLLSEAMATVEETV